MDAELAEIRAMIARQQQSIDAIKGKIDKLAENAKPGFLGLAGGVTLVAVYSKLNDIEKMVKELKRR